MNLVPRKIFFDDFFDDFMPSVKVADNMKCDIYEKEGKYFIEMDIPGFDKNDIDIDVENKYLTITASKEESSDEEDKSYIRKERSYSKTSRSFYIGDVEESDIKAEFKNGILKVIVPKEEEKVHKKKIEIE